MDQNPFETEDFQKCADFHGHICPGLAIGYRAAKAGMDWLKENRSVDEEVVSIVENNACGVDAVQVLTGCTFGKGNFLFMDHGKQAFTFMGRSSGRGIRVALQPGCFDLSDKHRALLEKTRTGNMSPQEREEFGALHHEKAGEILEKPLKDLFILKEVDKALPPKAVIEPSVPCDRCGEPTMVSKLETSGGQKICRDCSKN
jgi:formylmethanofuran dehydrogenase subunit E